MASDASNTSLTSSEPRPPAREEIHHMRTTSMTQGNSGLKVLSLNPSFYVIRWTQWACTVNAWLGKKRKRHSVLRRYWAWKSASEIEALGSLAFRCFYFIKKYIESKTHPRCFFLRLGNSAHRLFTGVRHWQWRLQVLGSGRRMASPSYWSIICFLFWWMTCEMFFLKGQSCSTLFFNPSPSFLGVRGQTHAIGFLGSKYRKSETLKIKIKKCGKAKETRQMSWMMTRVLLKLCSLLTTTGLQI